MRALAILVMLMAGCSGPAARGKPNAGSGSAIAPTIAQKQPLAAKDVQIVITGATIRMNGTKISGTPMVADLIAVYGKPDRTWDSGGRNKIHTWDRLGLLVYEPKDGRCVSATFPYKAMSSAFTPDTLFAGSITVDGNAFAPTTGLATVKRWRGATQPYTRQSVVFDRGDFHVFTISEKGSTSIDLVELTFWQRGRGRTIRKPPTPIPDNDEERCKSGDAARCSSLALAYQMGTKGRREPERAYELAKLGCTGGDPFGCVMLHYMLKHGRGVAKSDGEAAAAIKRACTLGYKAACEPIK